MTTTENCLERGAAMTMTDTHTVTSEADARRCWGCRKLWPRTDMRWGSVTEGPLWYPRTIRVLRCPDCLE